MIIKKKQKHISSLILKRWISGYYLTTRHASSIHAGMSNKYFLNERNPIALLTKLLLQFLLFESALSI